MAITEMTDANPMSREINRGVMVAYINADLLQRANLDVRTSIVFYDEDGDFSCAVEEMPDESVLSELEAVGIAYWSKGI